MVVVADLEDRRLLDDVELSTRVLTPNGDDINDTVTLRLTVFALEGKKRLHAGVFDLSGRTVRDLSFDVDNPSGQHDVVWDGRDRSGRLVPPGSYLFRVRLDTDADATGTHALRALHVAY